MYKKKLCNHAPEPFKAIADQRMFLHLRHLVIDQVVINAINMAADQGKHQIDRHCPNGMISHAFLQ